jgi:rhodanese-related sulfurtransferase
MFNLFRPTTPFDARSLVQAGAHLIDVRNANEYAAGHLPRSTNIPLGELSRRLGEVGPRVCDVVVYCQSGGRSAAAARLLRQAGFMSVHDLGSIRNW